MRAASAFLALTLSLAVATPLAALDKNFYEWIAVAPVVVTAESQGQDGKLSLVRVERVLRGEIPQGETLPIRVRIANRNRDRLLHPRAAKLERGHSYILLLRPSPPRRKQIESTTFDLVRGVEGIRPLPAEGATPVVEALATFVDIQRSGSEESWVRLRAMLSETQPILLDTALELHLKFRRGDFEMLADVRPLLDHPQAQIRELAAGLIGQILDRNRFEPPPDRERLQSELVARARRDPVIEVRIAATRTLDHLDGESVLTILDEIADDDPDQGVRYTAEALAYERRSRSKAPGTGPN